MLEAAVLLGVFGVLKGVEVMGSKGRKAHVRAMYEAYKARA